MRAFAGGFFEGCKRGGVFPEGDGVDGAADALEVLNLPGEIGQALNHLCKAPFVFEFILVDPPWKGVAQTHHAHPNNAHNQVCAQSKNGPVYGDFQESREVLSKVREPQDPSGLGL